MRAGLEYDRDAKRIANEQVSKAFPEGFKLKYVAGSQALADVMQIKLDSTFLNNLFQPQVPKPTLPFDPADCMPLPPFDAEDEASKENKAEVKDANNMQTDD